jgi:hypothetical protein
VVESSSSQKILETILECRLEDAREDLDEKRRIAARRSGARSDLKKKKNFLIELYLILFLIYRGKDARKVELEAEATVEDLEKK